MGLPSSDKLKTLLKLLKIYWFAANAFLSGSNQAKREKYTFLIVHQKSPKAIPLLIRLIPRSSELGRKLIKYAFVHFENPQFMLEKLEKTDTKNFSFIEKDFFDELKDMVNKRIKGKK